MPIIISALHFPWETIDDCCRTAREGLGLDGIELSLQGSYQHPHCTREDLTRLPALKAQYGLTVDAHIWEDLAQLGEEAGAAALLGWLAVCQVTGIDGLVIHGGSDSNRREGIARTRRTFARVFGAYERAGVVLKLENHYAYEYHDCRELFSEPWEFLEVLPHFDSPALRCCFDTGHGHMTRNWPALLRELAPYLVHVHLADNGGVDDDHRPYRHGTVPWDAMFDLLAEIDFHGTFCVEFPVREERAPFEQCVTDITARWGR
jgi:sugar phosphate isomerase/epimerase